MQTVYECGEKRPGFACVWADSAGKCRVLGGCSMIVAECEGCSRVIEVKKGQVERDLWIGSYCMVTPWPELRWEGDKTCNMATHIKKRAADNEKQKVNPLKASKRRAHGKK